MSLAGNIPRGPVTPAADDIAAAFAEMQERSQRRTIAAALRYRMRLLHEATANARRLGCEDAAACFLAAHNEASDVLAAMGETP